VIVIHDPRCVEFSRSCHPERPERLIANCAGVENSAIAIGMAEHSRPGTHLLRAHSPEHVEQIKTATQDL